MPAPFDFRLPFPSLPAPQMFDPASHRDFLGACLGSGIERSKVGDIIVTGEQGCQILCAPSLVEHLEAELTQVGLGCRAWLMCGLRSDGAAVCLCTAGAHAAGRGPCSSGRGPQSIKAAYMPVHLCKAAYLHARLPAGQDSAGADASHRPFGAAGVALHRASAMRARAAVH